MMQIVLLLWTMVLFVCFDLFNSFELKSDPDSVNWTHDQLIYSQSLYQLSYIRALQIGVKYVVQEQEYHKPLPPSAFLNPYPTMLINQRLISEKWL